MLTTLTNLNVMPIQNALPTVCLLTPFFCKKNEPRVIEKTPVIFKIVHIYVTRMVWVIQCGLFYRNAGYSI